jgi:1,4-alpha-glucan branching enzyme
MKATTKPKSENTKAPAGPPASGTKTGRLSLDWAQARNVSLAGSFNDWQPSPLQGDGSGRWSVELSLAPGDYEYLFVIDDCWLPDPACAEGRPNPFGGENSVLHVPVQGHR